MLKVCRALLCWPPCCLGFSYFFFWRVVGDVLWLRDASEICVAGMTRSWEVDDLLEPRYLRLGGVASYLMKTAPRCMLGSPVIDPLFLPRGR